MQNVMKWPARLVITGLFAGAWMVATTTSSIGAPTDPPATAPSVDLRTGWSALQEGTARGTIELDASYPTNTDPHLLRIAVTATAQPGEGRAGAVNATHIPVVEGSWYDVTFSAATERASIGLVFSLESDDGKVLARTTLPEIGGPGRGRGRGRGAPATAPATWPKYLVSLHARASDPLAHLVITPIEPTDVWLDGLTLTPRAAGN